MSLAPIVLFVYKRPWHTQQTLEALAANELADQSILYIFADGPQTDATEEQKEKIRQVRELIRSRKWCKEVHIVERQRNWGLADNIIDGVTQIVNRYGRIIVLEDDLVTSPGFLRYMNEALELYANEPRVMHISGYMFPVEGKLPDTFFYNANSCWGWATWARAWKYFINDPLYLYRQVTKSKNSIRRFNIENSCPFTSQLEANIIGTLKTWCVRWYASFFIAGGYALYPRCSLVNNIGHDSSGEHCNAEGQNVYYCKELALHIPVQKQPVKENLLVRQLMQDFYKNRLKIEPFEPPSPYSFKNKLAKCLPNGVVKFYRWLKNYTGK
ncbi:MAG: glycosyltransferase [Cytophagales bacterium]|nr:glycosyltransferase [Bernardetiaceae bacterium]MDW8211319.1 glycosyltransferase [Cytophagales bacterium]